MKQEKEPNCREGTLRNFRSCHKHLKALDPKPLKKITADDIRQLLLASPSPEVRDKCYKMLAMIFRAAVQYDLVTANIMDKVSRFKTPKAHPQRASPAAKATSSPNSTLTRERFCDCLKVHQTQQRHVLSCRFPPPLSFRGLRLRRKRLRRRTLRLRVRDSATV